MSVKQISVFLENRKGTLQKMTAVLKENGIDMRAFSLAETSDFGIARIIVSDVYKTTTVLRDAGFVHTISSVLAVEVSDTPGGLHTILSVLEPANINVEYVYAFLGRKENSAYMIFKVENEQAAKDALREAHIRLVQQEELSEL